ncbi:MAG: sarcosine oxidase subunit alpha, partial [Agrobacterium sp.]
VERVSDHLPITADGQPRQRYWKIVAAQAIFATGATERPIAFGGNDRPGVMMASAIQTYVNRYAVAPGKRVAIFTVCDTGYDVAADLAAAGVEIAAIIDARGQPTRDVAFAPVIAGEVVRTFGRSLKAIEVRRFDGGM